MSLAADILKARADLSPPSQYKPRQLIKPPVRRKTKAPLPIPKARIENPRIPGVCYVYQTNRWMAYFYDGENVNRLGEFSTQARAHIALRLYKHWRKRAFTDIPHKPTISLYRRRNTG